MQHRSSLTLLVMIGLFILSGCRLISEANSTQPTPAPIELTPQEFTQNEDEPLEDRVPFTIDALDEGEAGIADTSEEIEQVEEVVANEIERGFGVQAAVQQESVSSAVVEAAFACIPSQPQWFNYTVVQGDTLAAIARRSGSTVSILASVNCISNPNLIFVRQVIKVPRDLYQQPVLPVINWNEPIGVMCLIVNRTPTYRTFVYRLNNGPAEPIGYLGNFLPLQTELPDAFLVQLPNGQGFGWVSKSFAMKGANCDRFDVPILQYSGAPDPGQCVVFNNRGPQLTDVREQPNSNSRLVARLATWVPVVSRIVGGFEVQLPNGGTGWVIEGDVQLSGANCPGTRLPSDPPIITNPNPKQSDKCYVEVPPMGEMIAFYRQAHDENTLLGYLTNHALWLRNVDGGYEIILPDSRVVWTGSGQLSGAACPNPNPLPMDPIVEIPECIVSASGSDVVIFSLPDQTSERSGILAQGETIQPQYRTDNGFYGFDPTGAHVAATGFDHLLWVDSSNAGLRVNTACRDLEMISSADVIGVEDAKLSQFPA